MEIETVSWTSTINNLVIVGSTQESVEDVVQLFRINTPDDPTASSIGEYKSTIDNLVMKGVDEVSRQDVLKSVKSPAKCDILGTTRITVQEMMKLLTKPEPVKEVMKLPAKRGEHIINNNVLKVFKTIVQTFIKQCLKSNYEMLVKPGTKVYEACESPLPPIFKQAVQKELLVHLDGNIKYIDANSTAYGRKIEIVINVLVFYMETIYCALHSGECSAIPRQERNIAEVVEEFIAREYFVDQFALNYWLTEVPHNKRLERSEKFVIVKKEVIKMFRRLEEHYNDGEIFEWVKEIRKANDGNK